MKPPCSIDGCEKQQHRAQGVCQMHYTRKRRHGDYSIRLPNNKPRPFEETLELYVPDRPDDGCWIWQGFFDPQGYGRVQWNRRPAFAHRAVYQELKGVELVPSQLLCHTCDNPPCVNPAHLFVGTHADNLRDMRSKGRGVKGMGLWSAKLNDEQVIEARWRHQNEGASNRSLAAEYGLTETPMSQLLRGITWRHLPLVPTNEDRKANDT